MSARTSLILAAALALPLTVALSVPASADDWHRRGGHHRGGTSVGVVLDFHGRDYHRFSPYERRVWGNGYWYRGYYGPRYGWWWRTGGYWYPYEEPVYPYPTYVPPPVVVSAPPPAPEVQAPPQFWYYCDNPSGYYPYVRDCPTPWRTVPAEPPRER